MTDEPQSDLEKERALTQARTRSGLVSLHPTVYLIIVLLAGVFVLSSWTFFGLGGYTGLVLVVLTLIVGFVIAIPSVLARVWRRHHDPVADPGAPTDSFSHWLKSDVTVQRYHVVGRDAAAAALLPIAAGAIGMLLLALIHALEISS